MSDTNWKLVAQEAEKVRDLALTAQQEATLARCKAERERDGLREQLADANRGAEVNAKANQLLAVKLAEARQEADTLRRQVVREIELLVAAEEWMSADGCDCGTDEIDACSLCRIRAFLAAAQQAKEAT
jgi:hypothetical protein